jgi:GAF domain-containing protein
MGSAIQSTDQAFAIFSQTLQASGVRPALAYLLSLTNYRFISIFRFENGKANSVVHFDRENPQVLASEEVPDTATYCCYVRDSGGAFTTANALEDTRLASHPARETVLAYCGVPIMDPEGRIMGTLCHYDVVPRDPQQVDLLLLLQVASALAYGGHVPPYPRPACPASNR